VPQHGCHGRRRRQRRVYHCGIGEKLELAGGLQRDRYRESRDVETAAPPMATSTTRHPDSARPEKPPIGHQASQRRTNQTTLPNTPPANPAIGYDRTPSDGRSPIARHAGQDSAHPGMQQDPRRAEQDPDNGKRGPAGPARPGSRRRRCSCALAGGMRKPRSMTSRHLPRLCDIPRPSRVERPETAETRTPPQTKLADDAAD